MGSVTQHTMGLHLCFASIDNRVANIDAAVSCIPGVTPVQTAAARGGAAGATTAGTAGEAAAMPRLPGQCARRQEGMARHSPRLGRCPRHM